MSKKDFSFMDVIPVTIASVLFFSQMIIGLFIVDNSKIDFLQYAGILLFILSGWIFGMLPVREFRKEGCVMEGKGYMHTTKVVDSGVFSVIRHPQFTTWILWAIAAMLVFQHWLIVVLGIPVIVCSYVDILRADKRLIERFGEDYKRYMEKVPRSNFLLGIICYLRRGKIS